MALTTARWCLILLRSIGNLSHVTLPLFGKLLGQISFSIGFVPNLLHGDLIVLYLWLITLSTLMWCPSLSKTSTCKTIFAVLSILEWIRHHDIQNVILISRRFCTYPWMPWKLFMGFMVPAMMIKLYLFLFAVQIFIWHVMISRSSNLHECTPHGRGGSWLNFR